jgi:hypothetical protein
LAKTDENTIQSIQVEVRAEVAGRNSQFND